ncbi:ATP-binding protein [Bacillus sp. FJAT-50079]|uniref:ATP-binding protein n=1 Tax=Bacillus sp. FJAT-50079 TaxID=2833577 RepID=UPI001BC932DB|nr:ATP-binding protein [Bacillus sp. FJAT-50079]MBS4207192.1 ATP-binding protein [Bacillus sp. FJAT-50079]
MSGNGTEYERKPTTVLMGRQCNAIYHEQKINDYKHNPLIEALPDILTRKKVIELLMETPNFVQDEINESPEIRIHLIQQIKHHFIQPMPIHLELEVKISTMIRTGYVGRNPVSPLYAKQFSVGISEIFRGGYDLEKGNILGNRSTATNFSIIGISGIGKSTAIEKILLLYPQVIIHSDYEHNGIYVGYLKQIVWLVIECPFNASRGSLCKNFFMAVDNILGTNYYKQFVKARMNESDLIDKMAHVAALHCIGVLVFDEIQRMKRGNEGKLTINFFVELHNKLGVPLVFIGTYSSIDLFTPLLATARRASGMGILFFDRMEKDKKWDLFLEKLWRYQWLKEYTPLSEEMNELFYHETQGITDLVVNLFIQVQLLALSLGKEKISINFIKRAAETNLKILRPTLIALQTGDIEKLKKIEDLKPDWVDVNNYIKEIPESVMIEGEMQKEHENALSNAKEFVQYINFAQSLGLSKKEAVELVSEVLEKESNDSQSMNKVIAEKILFPDRVGRKPKENKAKNKKTTIEYYLHVIGLKVLKEKKPLEEELRNLNIIKPFNEFIG